MTEARRLGSYELVARIGEGGMGEVWRASNQRLMRDAAVKLIRDDMLAPGVARGAAMARDRFVREARAVASLQSPHTVQVYDGGLAADGTLFFAMELLDGVDLQTLVTEHGPQPIERVVHILRQALHSLHEAHERGLVHRDIKPANVMVTRYGGDFDHVKVLDFGLVRDLVRPDALVTAEDVVAGTPAYLAPEVIGGTTIDARSDLYSLGCTAYFLLTGELVFEATTSVQMAVAHATERPKAPSLRGPRGTPMTLDDVILRCLSKSAEGRPRSARALDDELRAIEVTLPTRWTRARACAWWATRSRALPRASVADEREDEPGLPAAELALETTALRVTRRGMRRV